MSPTEGYIITLKNPCVHRSMTFVFRLCDGARRSSSSQRLRTHLPGGRDC